MAITAEAAVDVDASPQDVLEFVLDLRAYAEVDDKIVRVTSVDGPDEAGRGTVKMWGRMGWLPPAPDTQDFVLERWERIMFTGARRRPARLVFDFTGEIICAVGDGSTTITHRYEFDFKGPLRWFESRLQGWLDEQIADEVTRLAARFE